MTYAIGFDVYGTIVDPLELNEHLRPLVGDQADKFAELWREKQLEYAFRRGLMKQYANFGICTKQALLFTQQTLQTNLSAADQQQLLDEYRNLRAFADVAPGLAALKEQGHTLVAFSNGVAAKVCGLLENAGVAQHLSDVLSVDDLKTFKPDPAVYDYLARRVARTKNETWLVSSNPWDVIGAKSAGLKAAWIKRKPDKIFDPWGVEPDVTASNLEELAGQLAQLTN
ncbi:MAG: haloacid dehalogenase type II [Pyrinomonadaceae bacterium]